MCKTMVNLEELKNYLHNACKLESDIFIMENYLNKCKEDVSYWGKKSEDADLRTKNFKGMINCSQNYGYTDGHAEVRGNYREEMRGFSFVMWFIIEIIALFVFDSFGRPAGLAIIYSAGLSILAIYSSGFHSNKTRIMMFAPDFLYLLAKYLILFPLLMAAVGEQHLFIFIFIMSIMTSIVFPIINYFVRRIDINEWNTKHATQGLQTVQGEKVTALANLGNRQGQIQDISQPLSNAKNDLEKLYRVGLLFSKYQNILAVHKISEYLDSGRCNALEGSDGAYNLFENEVRLDRIQAQLGEVNNHLENLETIGHQIISAIGGMRQAINGLESAIANQDINVVVNVDGYRYY